jgi:hypothetical protein
MGAEHTPMRGDPVSLTVVECDGRSHALDATVRGDSVTYRDASGQGRWMAADAKAPRYILLSDLVGRDIDMAGTTSGEVQKALIEVYSGRVAFVGMDPNENFLGLGDKIVLVPWSTFRVGPDTLTLDAEQRAVEQATAWPDDLATLTPTTIANAYAAFGARQPEFAPRGNGQWRDKPGDRDPQANRDPQADRNQWGRESPFVRTFAAGEPANFEGEVVSVGAENVQPGAPDALVMTVRAKDGTKRVILGPDWFAAKQNLLVREGDRVRVEGRSATWNGSPWVSAWTVTKGEHSWKFWQDSKPVWGD